MSKEVVLESILDQFIGIKTTTDRKKELILSAMRESCKQTLELAAENAKLNVGTESGIVTIESGYMDYNSESHVYINKRSITDTINQIK